jgi:hypothetical protein
VTVERLWQPKKASESIVSTEEGIVMDRSDEQNRNAECPMQESLEWASNVTIERQEQVEKELGQRHATEKGMQIRTGAVIRAKA